MPKKLTQEQVDEKVSLLGYTLLEDYKGSCAKKHSVKHNECGYVWDVVISSLRSLKGCPKCSGRLPWDIDRLESLLKETGYSLEIIPDEIKTDTKLTLLRNDGYIVTTCIDKLIEARNAKYRKVPCTDDYFSKLLGSKNCELVCTVNSDDTMRCNVCSHVWTRKSKHVRWQYRSLDVVCPECRKQLHDHSGFSFERPAELYYLRVDTGNGVFYKVGITNRDVARRFNKTDLRKITVIDTLYYNIGRDAYEHEQQLLKDFEQYRYKGEPVLKSGGSSELFTRDVLFLDKSNPDTLNQKPL
jgi:hypothetical protein